MPPRRPKAPADAAPPADSGCVSRRAKVEHVKAGKQTRNHDCHWPGCAEQVPPAMWGCRSHWFSLPQDLRERIWNAYVPGQEIRRSPSRLAEKVGATRACVLEEFGERAGIREYLGGMTREDAEARAMDDVEALLATRTTKRRAVDHQELA